MAFGVCVSRRLQVGTLLKDIGILTNVLRPLLKRTFQSPVANHANNRWLASQNAYTGVEVHCAKVILANQFLNNRSSRRKNEVLLKENELFLI